MAPKLFPNGVMGSASEKEALRKTVKQTGGRTADDVYKVSPILMYLKISGRHVALDYILRYTDSLWHVQQTVIDYNISQCIGIGIDQAGKREEFKMVNEENMMDAMSGTKAPIIVLSADAIQSDTKDGKISGMSVFYTFNTTFENMYNNPNSFGQKPGKIWMDHDLIQKIVAAPAKYIGTFGMKIGSDGKPVLSLKDLDYICDVKLTDVATPEQQAAADPNYPKYQPAPEKPDGKPAGK